MQLYEFKFTSKFNKLLSYLYGIWTNLLLPIFCEILCLGLLLLCNLDFTRIKSIIYLITILMILLGIFFVIRYMKNLKGVFLTESYIEIDRYVITNWNWKMKIVIKYSDIITCNFCNEKFKTSKYSKEFLIPFADMNQYVEIVTISNRKYYFGYICLATCHGIPYNFCYLFLVCCSCNYCCGNYCLCC